MTLPDDFQFSQSSLQDYADCPRRFELRYLDQLQWPAIEAEPIQERERHMRRGADFHHMVHQHLSGVPADALAGTAATDPDLQRWWAAYRADSWIAALPETRYPELTLSAPVNGYRLLAKYDLVALQPGQRAVIVDWKTAQRKPARERLQERLQTVVYRYVLVEAGAHLNGGAIIAPEQVEMVYWFAVDPAHPIRFPYDAAQYAQDRDMLISLVGDIRARAVFDKTADTHRCRFCVYRSLCDRGIEAGHEDEIDAEPGDETSVDLDFDFDQIAEIEF